VHGLFLGDEPRRWERLGFALDASPRAVEAGASPGAVAAASPAGVTVGGLRLALLGTGGGVGGWVLGGDSGPSEVDGIPTRWGPTPWDRAEPAHPNGAQSVDHVVVFTDDVDRTVEALQAVDGDLRRRAAPPQVPVAMAFVRLGGIIVEVAQAPDGGPTRIWGLVVTVSDLDALAARLGDDLGEPRPAVQPGRRIATVRPSAGLETALAFMTPRPPRAG